MRAFSKRMGIKGRRASRTSFTCSSTGLNGSTWTFASSIAISIRCGGCGVFVCGLIAFCAIYWTICFRFCSCISRRCSVVSWLSPFDMAGCLGGGRHAVDVPADLVLREAAELLAVDDHADLDGLRLELLLARLLEGLEPEGD